MRLLLFIMTACVLLTGPALADPADDLLDQAEAAAAPAIAPAVNDDGPLHARQTLLRARMAVDAMDLELIEAELALGQGQTDQAREHLTAVLGALQEFPADLGDTRPIRARLARLAERITNVEHPQLAAGVAPAETEPGEPIRAAEATPDREFDQRVDMALQRLQDDPQPLQQPYADTTLDAEAVADRTVNDPNNRLYRGQYSPARSLIDRDALRRLAEERLAYQADLNALNRQMQAEHQLRARQAEHAPLGVLTYPQDWPQRVAGRERYADGIIVRTEPVVGPDGQTYYSAVYDVSDLLAPIPNFPGPDFRLDRQLRADFDREALRRRSMIFGGYARDLAEGVPLLGYFGGVNNHYYPAVAPYPVRHAELMTIINDYMGQ